jgi:hypothetical protein
MRNATYFPNKQNLGIWVIVMSPFQKNLANLLINNTKDAERNSTLGEQKTGINSGILDVADFGYPA